MGTNFYLVSNETRPKTCPECGHETGTEPVTKIHIGKSSGGWCFALHIHPESRGIHDLEEWENRFHDHGFHIEDEDGNTLEPWEMSKKIRERSWPHKVGFDYEANSAVHGPNGLARHKIDGRFCIDHGSGTWDLMVGDFS